MPVDIRTFQENYNLIKARIQSTFPKSDFTEGSFLDVLTGSFSLAYQELQALISQSFSRTFFSDPATTGVHLDRLAQDHFYLSRPAPQKAIGNLKITRISGNTERVQIPKGTTFKTGADPELEYITTTETATIASSAPGTASINVGIEAIRAGSQFNVPADSVWTLENVDTIDIQNEDPVAGGTDEMNDEDFREYIRNFVLSVTDGTVAGLESTAQLVPGVADTRVIKKLVDVGTLTSGGALETAPKRFKAIELLMYVAGDGVKANSAIIDKVKEQVERQLSAGEVIDIQPARIMEINVTLALTFSATQEAIQLSTDRDQLIEAIREYINDLAIGTDFNKTTMQNTFAQKNGWKDVSGQADLITNVVVSKPVGNITTVASDQKAVAGPEIIIS